MTNESWLRAAAATRARQRAAGAIKSAWRDEGRKLQDFRISEHRKAIGEYLAQHPEVIERVAMEVAAWRGTKIKTFVQKSKR
jgi:hypothetical protein